MDSVSVSLDSTKWKETVYKVDQKNIILQHYLTFHAVFDHQPCVITSEIVRDRLMVDVVPRMNVSVILDSKGKTVRTFPFVITTAAATECA